MRVQGWHNYAPHTTNFWWGWATRELRNPAGKILINLNLLKWQTVSLNPHNYESNLECDAYDAIFGNRFVEKPGDKICTRPTATWQDITLRLVNHIFAWDVYKHRCLPWFDRPSRSHDLKRSAKTQCVLVAHLRKTELEQPLALRPPM